MKPHFILDTGVSKCFSPEFPNESDYQWNETSFTIFFWESVSGPASFTVMSWMSIRHVLVSEQETLPLGLMLGKDLSFLVVVHPPLDFLVREVYRGFHLVSSFSVFISLRDSSWDSHRRYTSPCLQVGTSCFSVSFSTLEYNVKSLE
jgi:hypothetical protein